VHTSISGVAHFRMANDEACLARIRELITELPYAPPAGKIGHAGPAARPAKDLYDLLPEDHRQLYDIRAVLDTIIDKGTFDEFQADYACEMICGTARIEGVAVGIIMNARGMIKVQNGPPRFGGIIYTESAQKTAYFIETMNRHSTPILFVQDVSGFMVGPEAEHSGIIRAGAQFVEAMATAQVPKVVLTINHASGAGYYAMAGQGFDPDFIFTWPSGRMGVMEGESAVMALFGPELETLKKQKREPDPVLQKRLDSVRADYDHQLDAKYAAARGFVDAVIVPEETREILSFALRATLHNPGAHIGPFGLDTRG
jgi:3-methylcrotonyl-CoA carboxylase beta subunit